jgi:NADH-quinone oxidoreductase subunit J
MELVVFVIGAAVIVAGALGVVLRSNPVHAALSLVMTLFGVAVLFVAQDAHFLAVVQVIVYGGAIVVLFLFVIMLLGVDRVEDLKVDPLKGQRSAAIVVGVAVLALVLGAIIMGGKHLITGARSTTGVLDSGEPNINVLARALFSHYVFAFEVTSVLLVIAVVGTVLLARKPAARQLSESEEAAP